MIYICIPTHNEQQTVGVVLWKLRQVFQDFPRDYQLLVADDASTDKTAEVLEPYTRVLPLTVIRTERKQGYAASIEMLLREAVRRSEYPKRDVIVTLQADFSEEPDDLVPLLKRMEAGADVAVGNKVSKSKDPRARRLSRRLAGFFLRGVKWPEGVETPFDGYRAYRLHAIKRAIEERADKRLIRFDSWAGHAELLRAVLPHARRVDVIDVVDRADRLQRPRREQPFAAALQVRTLAADKEPQGLAGVEELDRIAATASRSRDRAALSRTAIQAARPSSANGKRGEESSRGGDGRTRRGAGRGEGGRAEVARGSGEGRERQRSRGGQPTAGDTARRQARQGRGGAPVATGGEPAQQRRRGPKADAVTPVAPAGIAAGEPKAKKKRRRRRKKSAETNVNTAAAPGAAPAGAPVGLPSAATVGESVEAVDTDGPVEAGEAVEAGVVAQAGAADMSAEGGAERKRRRRGGRRGGRGRRKARAEGGSIAAEGGAEGGVTDGVDASPAAVESAPTGSDNE